MTQSNPAFPLKQVCLRTLCVSHIQTPNLAQFFNRMMSDHRQHGVTGTQISSFNPAYQIHSNCDGTGDIEFDFWSTRKTWYYDNFNNLDGSEIEFQVQAFDKESFGDCPLPSWRDTNKVTDASPLLPNNHFYSNFSHTRRKQAIEEGRKELMDMISNMPESCYELSLKDIVVVNHEQHVEAAVEEKAVPVDKSIHTETEIKTTTKKKRKVGSISRTPSMDADSFLIKTFLPSSLSFRKKSSDENSPKLVSPYPSSERSEKPGRKKWWIKRIFIRSNHKSRIECSSSSNNNNSSIESNNNNTSRKAIRSSLPGCWLFFFYKKSKAKS